MDQQVANLYQEKEVKYWFQFWDSTASLDNTQLLCLLKKRTHTGSQTRKGRFGRWDNVVNNFLVKRKTALPKHVAIVDDVITTGATIEALVRSIQENYPDIRVSIISLALTK